MDSKKQGEGRYTFGDGSVYEGEFINDSPHGVGKLRYSNGEVYEGHF